MLPACLFSLFSVADIHANGLHSSIPFPDCIVQSGNTMNARGICLCILQRSVELRWYHRMDENYERTLCRVHVLWDRDDNRSLSPLICTLYVLIGFHHPLHPCFISLGCHTSVILSLTHSPRAVFLHHTDMSANL